MLYDVLYVPGIKKCIYGIFSLISLDLHHCISSPDILIGWAHYLRKKKNVHKDMRKNSSAGHGTGQHALGGPSRILDRVTSRAAFPPQPFCESVGACVWGLNFIIAPQISHGLTWGEDLGKGWKWPSSHQAYPRLTPSAVVGQILSSW